MNRSKGWDSQRSKRSPKRVGSSESSELCKDESNWIEEDITEDDVEILRRSMGNVVASSRLPRKRKWDCGGTGTDQGREKVKEKEKCFLIPCSQITLKFEGFFAKEVHQDTCSRLISNIHRTSCPEIRFCHVSILIVHYLERHSWSSLWLIRDIISKGLFCMVGLFWFFYVWFYF